MPSVIASDDVIAFLGLGRMGARMAARLVGAGHEVTVWNRSSDRSSVPGARVAPTAVAAVDGADIAITMLSDPAAATDVLFGSHGAAAARPSGSLLVEMSTVGPHAVADIRRRLPESVALVDAPVLGSVEPAAKGTLLVLVGGADADVARGRKVLEVLGTRGLGAFAAQAIPATETRYALSHAAKDLALAQQSLGQRGGTLSLAAAARERLASAEQAGLGGNDLSAIFGHDFTTGERRAQKINPTSVPPPAGAYSHAVRAGDLLFVSGQAALDENGDVIGEGDVGAQSEFVFDCLERILADQGATLDDVVSIRTFLTDMTMLPAHGAVRRRRITGEPPASTTVEVSRLFRPGLLVEVDVVASLPAATASS